MATAQGGGSTLLAMLDNNDNSRPARSYWWGLALAGLGALTVALLGLARLGERQLAMALAGAGLAALAALFPVRIPGTRAAQTGGGIFVFLVLLLFGPAAAAVAAAADALAGGWRTTGRWLAGVASAAPAAVAMLVCGELFGAALGALAGLGAPAILAGLVALALFVAAYIGLGVLLGAALASLAHGRPPRLRAWLGGHAYYAVACAGNAAIAWLLLLAFERFGPQVLAGTLPIIAMFLATLHFHSRQAEANERVRQERLEAAEREAALAARHLEALRASESRSNGAFAHAAIGMALVSTGGTILQVNPAMCRLLGAREEDLVGAPIDTLVHSEEAAALSTHVERLVSGAAGTLQTEVRSTHREGYDMWLSVSAAFFPEGVSGERCLIFQLQDVTARRRAEARLHHIAFHDALTNLPNRSQFNEQLGRAIARARRDPQRRFAVMFLDFDRFKIVNDSLGHRAGDELLVSAARRLRSQLRGSDLVARLSGDEFAILIEDIDHESHAVELAERLQRALATPMRLGEVDVTASASIGITFSSFGYTTPEQALRDADIAMYRAKLLGRARYALFDVRMHEEIAAQLRLEADLRHALEGDEIEVAFQPVFALRSRRLIGFEALARWAHPERGDVSPTEFVPAAEEIGLAGHLGARVLETACRQLAGWHARHPAARGLCASINVCGAELEQAGYPGRVAQALRDHGLEPRHLVVEVNESVIMARKGASIPALSELRALGVRVAVDDFGTGYSSLSYLHTLPIDNLKIDRSFVGRMSEHADNVEIVRTVLTLGRSLGKRVFAEGIESEAQLAQLVDLQCEFGQGHVFAPPLREDQAEALIAREVEARAAG